MAECLSAVSVCRTGGSSTSRENIQVLPFVRIFCRLLIGSVCSDVTSTANECKEFACPQEKEFVMERVGTDCDLLELVIFG